MRPLLSLNTQTLGLYSEFSSVPPFTALDVEYLFLMSVECLLFGCLCERCYVTLVKDQKVPTSVEPTL